MPKIAVVGPKSNGASDLVKALRSLGAEVVRSQSFKDGYLNVGWGVSGSDFNAKLPPNKLWELTRLKSHDVNVPPFSQSFAEITKIAASQRPEAHVFGRKLRHTKGRDIVHVVPSFKPTGIVQYITTTSDYAIDFWTVVIPKRREYRVHVFKGKVFRSGTKMKLDGSKTDAQPIWNLDHGFQIRYEEPAPMSAKILAKAAVKACDLDYAAVDIIEDAKENCYVLELNCRPGLHGNTAVKYAEKFIQYAKE